MKHKGNKGKQLTEYISMKSYQYIYLTKNPSIKNSFVRFDLKWKRKSKAELYGV